MENIKIGWITPKERNRRKVRLSIYRDRDLVVESMDKDGGYPLTQHFNLRFAGLVINDLYKLFPYHPLLIEQMKHYKAVKHFPAHWNNLFVYEEIRREYII